jgi:hypothetical protein
MRAGEGLDIQTNAVEMPAAQAVKVILVSTRTRDRLPLDGGDGFKEIPGGPAHYIGISLDRLGCPYRLITGLHAIVDVIPGPCGEEYVIPSLPAIPLPGTLRAPAVILSPIIGEIDPERVPDVAGLLVVDLQGFVREPSRSTGESNRLFELSELLTRADIVKASSSELERLTPRSHSALSGALVLNTRGAEGAMLLQGGTARFVPANRVDAPHTIGAGDAFLAAFVSATLDGHEPVRAAEEATSFVHTILLERVVPVGGRDS